MVQGSCVRAQWAVQHTSFDVIPLYLFGVSINMDAPYHCPCRASIGCQPGRGLLLSEGPDPSQKALRCQRIHPAPVQKGALQASFLLLENMRRDTERRVGVGEWGGGGHVSEDPASVCSTAVLYATVRTVVPIIECWRWGDRYPSPPYTVSADSNHAYVSRVAVRIGCCSALTALPLLAPSVAQTGIICTLSE
jgi:hypothetical protein